MRTIALAVTLVILACGSAEEASCTPSCRTADGDAVHCGPDGCDGTCGTCADGESCSATGVCALNCAAPTSCGFYVYTATPWAVVGTSCAAAVKPAQPFVTEDLCVAQCKAWLAAEVSPPPTSPVCEDRCALDCAYLFKWTSCTFDHGATEVHGGCSIAAGWQNLPSALTVPCTCH